MNMNNMEKLLPLVLKSDGKYRFTPDKISKSLLTETTIDKDNAYKIALDVTKAIIQWKIKTITAPLIREVTCTQLLKHGFEKERLQYTRIGLPYYDINKTMDIGDIEIISDILDEHIINEYEAVKKLIEWDE